MATEEKQQMIELLAKEIVVGKDNITLNLCYLPSFKDLTNRQRTLRHRDIPRSTHVTHFLLSNGFQSARPEIDIYLILKIPATCPHCGCPGQLKIVVWSSSLSTPGSLFGLWQIGCTSSSFL
jgi:hypothetical protein